MSLIPSIPEGLIEVAMQKLFVHIGLLIICLWFAGCDSSHSPEADDYCTKGVAKADKGDLDGAIEDFTMAIKLDPNEATAYNNRGFAKYEKGDCDNAIPDFDMAIKLKPNYAKAYGNRGLAKKKKDDLKGALEDFETAIRLNPAYDLEAEIENTNQQLAK